MKIFILSLLALLPMTWVPAQTFVVENTADSGPGSLRQAILDANQSKGADTIQFSPDLEGEIVVSTPLAIDDLLTIQGQGAKKTKISGGEISSIFAIGKKRVLLADISLSLASNAAIVNRGILTVVHCQFFQNSNQNNGGAIVNRQKLAVIASSFVDNRSIANGGAIANTGLVVVENSTFSANLCEGNGAAIFNEGRITVDHCTIAFNRATANGGGIANTGTANISNTIISDNSADQGADGFGFFVSRGHNLISDDSATQGFGAIGDQLNVSADLENLGDNGGDTLTHALVESSPAIDKADPESTAKKDQRGFFRPFNGRADIGSFEVTGIVIRLGALGLTSEFPIELNFSQAQKQVQVSIAWKEKEQSLLALRHIIPPLRKAPQKRADKKILVTYRELPAGILFLNIGHQEASSQTARDITVIISRFSSFPEVITIRPPIGDPDTPPQALLHFLELPLTPAVTTEYPPGAEIVEKITQTTGLWRLRILDETPTLLAAPGFIEAKSN